MFVYVRGKKINLLFKDKIEASRLRDRLQEGEKLLGLCDPPSKKNRQIQVLKSLTGLQRLIIIIHELLHAEFWFLTEDEVNNAAEDIGRILWLLDYRGKV